MTKKKKRKKHKNRYIPDNDWSLMPEPWRRFWWWLKHPRKRSLKKHSYLRKEGEPESGRKPGMPESGE